MTQAEAIRQLDELPYHWTIGKGRIRRAEPLWAIEVFRPNGSGLTAVAADRDSQMRSTVVLKTGRTAR